MPLGELPHQPQLTDLLYPTPEGKKKKKKLVLYSRQKKASDTKVKIPEISCDVKAVLQLQIARDTRLQMPSSSTTSTTKECLYSQQ